MIGHQWLPRTWTLLWTSKFIELLGWLISFSGIDIFCSYIQDFSHVCAFLQCPLGTLIRRHRIPKPPPHDDEFYTVEDFNIGVEMTLYSRTFKITSCDDFTHNFLRKLGVRIRDTVSRPDDPYMGSRKAVSHDIAWQMFIISGEKNGLKSLRYCHHCVRFSINSVKWFHSKVSCFPQN